MTDPRAVAKIRAQEIISRMWNDWTLIADEKQPEKWACVKPTELLEEFTKALADERRRVFTEAAKVCEAEALIDDERGYYGKEMAKAIRAKAAQ